MRMTEEEKKAVEYLTRGFTPEERRRYKQIYFSRPDAQTAPERYLKAPILRMEEVS